MCRRCEHLALVVDIGNAGNLSTVLHIGSCCDLLDEVHGHLFTFTTNNIIGFRRLTEYLWIHEGRMDTTHDRSDLRIHLLGEFHDSLRLKDRRSDIGRHHHIRHVLTDDLLNLVIRNVIGHGVNKFHLIESCLF